MVGASVGTMSFVTVGCAEIDAVLASYQNPTGTQAGSGAQFTVSSEREGQLCEQALRTQSATDVNRLITEFPSSRCVAPVLNSLPSQTLAALSTQSVARLSPSVISRLSPRVRTQLPVLQSRTSGSSRY